MFLPVTSEKMVPTMTATHDIAAPTLADPTLDLSHTQSPVGFQDLEKKQPTECASCANARSAIAGALCLGVIAYTGPQVLAGTAHGVTMLAFILAFSALPALTIKNAILLMRTLKKVRKSIPSGWGR